MTVVRVGDATGRLVPPIGTVEPMPGAAHVRVSVDASTGGASEVQAAAAHGVPIELALLVDERGSGAEAMSRTLVGVPLAPSPGPLGERRNDPRFAGELHPGAAGRVRRWGSD